VEFDYLFGDSSQRAVSRFRRVRLIALTKLGIAKFNEAKPATIQFTGSPMPEYRPWTMTKSPSATNTPGSYLSVGGVLLTKLNRPSRPGSMCELCWT
jgi:hypothetical protein